ncbi:hypothetical protein HYQ45_012279 [Verticillium longisporum]|uniref:Ilp is an apoptosis inhibitor n=1 Tax=Verticillium longisporum TaxID=100787 RepID=A0A8I2ZE77_VERLO|nr:hypothetical protein HYQ45_012279 [Verticillium longisporum]
MAFASGASAGPSFHAQDPNFDIFDWYNHFQSCVRYFVDRAQYDPPSKLWLPLSISGFPTSSTQIPSSRGGPGPSGFPPSFGGFQAPGSALPNTAVSPIPFIRRLVATGFDYPAILHGFFGDDWVAGVGRLHEAERRNYLFAAKSRPWLSVKDSYDMADGQYTPFLRPLQEPSEKEIRAADASWSEWLSVADREWTEWMAMEDWVIGPRAPRRAGPPGTGIKVEDDE